MPKLNPPKTDAPKTDAPKKTNIKSQDTAASALPERTPAPPTPPPKKETGFTTTTVERTETKKDGTVVKTVTTTTTGTPPPTVPVKPATGTGGTPAISADSMLADAKSYYAPGTFDKNGNFIPPPTPAPAKGTDGKGGKGGTEGKGGTPAISADSMLADARGYFGKGTFDKNGNIIEPPAPAKGTDGKGGTVDPTKELIDKLADLSKEGNDALEDMKNPNGTAGPDKYKYKGNGQCDFGLSAQRAKSIGFDQNYNSTYTKQPKGHSQIVRTAEDKAGNKYKEILRFDGNGKMIEAYRSIQAKDKDGNYKLKGEFIYTSAEQRGGPGHGGAVTKSTGVFGAGGVLQAEFLKERVGTTEADKGKHQKLIDAPPVASELDNVSKTSKIFLNNNSLEHVTNWQDYGEDPPLYVAGSKGKTPVLHRPPSRADQEAAAIAAKEQSKSDNPRIR